MRVVNGYHSPPQSAHEEGGGQQAHGERNGADCHRYSVCSEPVPVAVVPTL